VNEKDFRQAVRWYRRAPVTHVAPEFGGLASPQKKDVSHREKARVWFPRPATCSVGVRPGGTSGEDNRQESAYGVLAVYHEKNVVVRGPVEKVGQPEVVNAPEVLLANPVTEDNLPHDVDTLVSDEERILQRGMSGDEMPAGNEEDGTDDTFAGMIASVETGLADMLAEKPVPGEMFPVTGDGEKNDGGDALGLAGLSEEEQAEIAGFDPALWVDDPDEAPVALAEEGADVAAPIAGAVAGIVETDEIAPEAGTVSETEIVADDTLPGDSVFEEVAEAPLMEALIADETVALAEGADAARPVADAVTGTAETEEFVSVAGAVSEPEMTAEATGMAAAEDASLGGRALEEAVEAALMDTLIADEASTLVEGIDNTAAESLARVEEVEDIPGAEMADARLELEVPALKAEGDTRQEVPDTVPEALSEAKENMVAEIVDLEEAISGEEVQAAVAEKAPDAVLADVAVSAVEEPWPEDAPQAEEAGTVTVAAAETDAASDALPVEMPDPETALADGIMIAEDGETPPDFDVPPVPVLDEMTAGPEVAIPEEQVFRDKIETHQRNKMAFAEYKVAAAYAREDTEESRREMVKWYTRAAENGHAVSQFNLGNIYYAGRGVGQNYTVAADWYELAAAQGVARAQDNLGLMYFHGRGRPVNPEVAVHWFRQAAIQGHAPAQYKLAMHLEAGVGTEPDLEEALHWYKKAVSQGDATARKDVERLMGQKEA
jgi:TPR repeat protein